MAILLALSLPLFAVAYMLYDEQKQPSNKELLEEIRKLRGSL